MLDIVVILFYDYFKFINRFIYFIGYSISGLVGLIYVCKYLERVKFLILLFVGVYFIVDW